MFYDVGGTCPECAEKTQQHYVDCSNYCQKVQTDSISDVMFPVYLCGTKLNSAVLQCKIRSLTGCLNNVTVSVSIRASYSNRVFPKEKACKTHNCFQY